jgi:hypothetical protein
LLLGRLFVDWNDSKEGEGPMALPNLLLYRWRRWRRWLADVLLIVFLGRGGVFSESHGLERGKRAVVGW